MKVEEALAALALKFSSGNNITVERATILREEYEALLNFVNPVLAENEIDKWLQDNR